MKDALPCGFGSCALGGSAINDHEALATASPMGPNERLKADILRPLAKKAP